MDVLYPVCCGLDVHKKTITACLRFPSARARAEEVRTFGTTTRELLRLADWLTAAGCTHVAMESTGVYWRPVYHILEASFEVLLVNAQHVKAVPGRKTDVKDCQWLAQLLEHGLLRGSFVPPAPLRELRELTRLPATACSGARPRSQPSAESAGDRQHQARRCRHRCPWRLRARHAARPHCRGT